MSRFEIAISYKAMKKRHNQITLILLLFAISLSNLYGQILLKETSLEKQIKNSSLVVEGKVLSKKAFWDVENKNIYTSNVIEVYKVFKGQPIETIEVITKGGTVGLSAEIVKPSLKLNVDDIGVFMLYENNINLKSKSSNKKYKAYGSLQGFYKYNLDSNEAVNPFNKKQGISSIFYNEIINITKTDFVEISNFNLSSSKSLINKVVLAPTAIVFSPTTATAGTKFIITITIPGGATGNFGVTKGKVSFSNADDGGATFIDALGSQIISWNSTQIMLEVPSEAGTGKIKVTNSDTSSRVSSTDLTITYSEINVIADNLNPGTDFAYSTQHINDNENGGYTWQMYTGFNTNANAKTAFLRAFDTWRCETGINWIIGSTTAINVAEFDGTNVIRFDVGSELETDVLGQCSFYFNGCVANGGTSLNWFVSELDIVFNDSENWNYSPVTNSTNLNQFDFETVALHELGHGHQLGHVIDTFDVMNYAISNSEEQRVLGPSNITCASDIQTRSTTTAVCGQLVMTNHPCYLSIDEEELKEAISIYPNPAKGIFNIKNSSLLSLDKVVIYDIRGRLISEYDMRNSARIKTINIVGVSKGMYFVNIHSEKAMITKKLILD